MPIEPQTGGAPPLIECDIPLGEPGFVVHDALIVSGWAVSPRGVTGVAVETEERTWMAGYGLDSPEAARLHPDVEGSERAGFHLAIDTSGWEPGPVFVAVSAYDPDGLRSSVEGTIDVRPTREGAEPVREAGEAAGSEDDGSARSEVALSLSSPTIQDGKCRARGPLLIEGWTQAPEGVEAVLVTIDETLQYEALRPIARGDLVASLGKEAAAEAGFTLTVDPVDLPPGPHLLAVSALSREGRAAVISAEVLSEPAQEAEVGLEGAGDALETAPEGLEPQEEGVDPDDPTRHWQERAILAEADGALARSRERLALAGEIRARREAELVKENGGAVVARLGAELSSCRERLAALRREADSMRRRSELSQAAADQAGRDIDYLRSQLETLQSESDSLGKALEDALESKRLERSSLQAELDSRQRELDSHRRDLGSLQRDLDSERAERVALAETLHEVQSSASWRLTKPLRAIKRLFTRDREAQT